MKGLQTIINVKRYPTKARNAKADSLIRTSTWIVMVLSLLGWAAQSNGGTVLMDNYYCSSLGMSWGVEQMAAALEASGHTVFYNNSPITAGSLQSFDAYVLFFPGVDNDLTPSQADTVADWVEAGHGLFLGAGRVKTEGVADNCNLISARWGLTYNSDDYSGVITDITYGHPATDGPNPPATRVDTFGIYMSCSLSLVSGLSLARYSGHTIMANVEPGAGRAVLIGDSIGEGPFDNDHLFLQDNQQLAINTVGYLVPEPATVLLLGLGGLALIRRRRKSRRKLNRLALRL